MEEKGETVSIIRPKAKFKINYIKPCTEKDKKIANAHISVEKPIDIAKLGEIFSKLSEGGFRNVKVLKNLGLVSFDFEEKSITLFEGGKILIKKAKNEKDVMRTVETISNLMKQYQFLSE